MFYLAHIPILFHIVKLYTLDCNKTSLDCYDVVALDLTVNAAPVTDFVPVEYPLCDNDQDGIENFDFDGFITIPTGITLTYYNSEQDARLGDPATEIPTPNDYPSAGAETIWVRAVNLDGCVTVSSFDLIIDTVPIYTPVPLFEICDDRHPDDGFTEFELDLQITPDYCTGW